MKILKELDPRICVKKFKLKGLTPCRSDQFRIILELRTAEDALELILALDHKDFDDTPGYIVLDDCLPDFCIPEFAISSQIFRNKTETPESAWENSVAQVLMEVDDLSVKLALNEEHGETIVATEDTIIATIYFGQRWETRGEISLEQISNYLKSA